MDISTITDIDKLKSLAFDAIQAIEIQQRNLQAIQQRIYQVEHNITTIENNPDGNPLYTPESPTDTPSVEPIGGEGVSTK